jgi:hypothetical protein
LPGCLVRVLYLKVPEKKITLIYTHFSLVGRGAWLNDRPLRLQPNDLPRRSFAPERVNSQQGRFRLSMSALLFSRIGLNNKTCPEARLIKILQKDERSNEFRKLRS